ncbi:unnamed protein product [Vitrella brassicaformis CCMP3155]|uniref:RNA polymerase II-associated protein 3 n=3 Tax=Vitrella brassicaformis TaxID=1169539 RepID=A0A0G4FYS4_VITBC|nr:unnamed protein product [Vitrella brassicaformis CCMP3155]|eukprot:CEM20586.1 unnamed protein product [Vitrella brassicaformis CCMP3155]
MSGVRLEDITFEAVDECEDPRKLKTWIKALEDDGSVYTDLLKKCRIKLGDLDPTCTKTFAEPTREEIAAATEDIYQWTEESKRNFAEQTRSHLSIDAAFQDRPPPRASHLTTTRPAREPTDDQREAEATDEGAAGAGGGGRKGGAAAKPMARDGKTIKDYYAAWDKFDVEAHEDASKEAAGHSDVLNGTKSEVCNPIPSQYQHLSERDRKLTAEHERKKGNEAFKAGDLDEAAECYGRSLSLDKESDNAAAAFCNRALVYLKQKKAPEALEDCQSALAIDPTYTKAMHRRGKARMLLGLYGDAVKDFRKALDREPNLKELKEDLDAAQKALERQKKGEEQAPEQSPKERERERERERGGASLKPIPPTSNGSSTSKSKGMHDVAIPRGSEEQGEGESDFFPEGLKMPSAAPSTTTAYHDNRVMIEEIYEEDDADRARRQSKAKPPTPAPAPPPAAPVPQPQPPQPPVDAAPSSTTTTTKPGSKRMVIVEDETDSDTEEQDQHTQRQQQQQQQQPAVDARAETTMVNGAEREEEGSGRVSATLEGLAEGKNKGNEAFMRGNIDEAVQWFSECIDLCEAGKVPGVEEPTTAPTSPPVSEGTKLLSFLYSNRSQAFLKLERWEDAERDGRRAFEVNPDNIKAAYKCAVAMSRQGAGKLDEALKTVQTVVDYHVARKVESREAVELKANILKQIVEQQDKRRAVSARTQATSALRLSKLAVPPVPPNPPRSAYELQRVWNSLKHHPDEQARYLRQRVTPDAIKRAFVKSSIEPDLLAEILKRMTEDTERTEGEKMTHEQVAGLLDALLSTYQASVQFKMLSSSELGHFRSLLTRLGDSQVARSVEGKAAHMGIAATAIAGR